MDTLVTQEDIREYKRTLTKQALTNLCASSKPSMVKGIKENSYTVYDILDEMKRLMVEDGVKVDVSAKGVSLSLRTMMRNGTYPELLLIPNPQVVNCRQSAYYLSYSLDLSNKDIPKEPLVRIHIPRWKIIKEAYKNPFNKAYKRLQ